MKINPDIYDEELIYENLGDEFFIIKGILSININLIYPIDPNIRYCILDNYNLLIIVNSLHVKLFHEISIYNLNKIEYFKDDEFIIYEVKEYGFYNKTQHKNGNLFIKINTIYI